MKFKLFRFLFMVLAVLCGSVAGSQELQASLPSQINFDGSTPYSASLLKKALIRVLNQNSVISINEENDFLVYQPYVTILTKDITSSAPPMIALTMDLNLSLVNHRDGTVFHTMSIPLKGVGTNENKAYSNAFQRIRYQQSAFDEFVRYASLKVGDYYDRQCDRIISEVEMYLSASNYDAAMLRLYSIPSVASECYQRASALLLESYKKSQNHDCRKLLNIAESALALRRYEAAVQVLIQINPDANCYGEAQKIKDQITKATGDQYNKVWDYQNKYLDVVGDALKAKYEAVSDLVTSEVLRRPVNADRRNESNGNNEINIYTGEKDRSSTNTSKETPTPVSKSEDQVAAIAQQGEQAPLFRIVTPAIRTDRSKIKATEANVSIYGFIDYPKKASKMFIDGLETSWDENGVFHRDIAIDGKEKEIEVKLINDNQAIAVQKLHVIKDVSAEQTKPSIPQIPQGQKRVALVIGNNNYQHTGPLRNAKNDAKDISEALIKLGFKVTSIYDASYEDMRKEVIKFSNKIEGADVALFYYSGHGLELDRVNYLIPVDARIESPQDIELKTLDVNVVLKSMQLTNDDKLNVVILDACRNNPFPSNTRGGGAGLTRMSPASGMLIAYATEPGKTASDGQGENGLYTGELIRQIKIPQRIEDVFMNTRIEVERKSRGTQRPWEEARLKGVFYLSDE